jgi:arylsulfatase A-like enzyme
MRPILPILLAATLLAAATFAATPPAKPNVILILADDLGWTDLACFGSDLHETPALDRLARDGMKFTQNYSACTVCSPTRAALLTGKYPARLRITDWIPGSMPDNPKLLVPDWTKHLPESETTLAEVFKAAGYATATIGKWHLAKVGTKESYPEAHGFDLNIAGTDRPEPPSFNAPYRIPTLTPEGPPGEHLSDRLGEEAATWIERVKDRPFFLYLPHFAVHTPIQARPDLTEKYRRKIAAKGGAEKLTHKNPAYGALLESMDSAIGRVREKLAQLALTQSTIVIFTSDNGGRVTRDPLNGLPATTSNAPLRVGKASAYEGGVRVPLIVSWPGVTKPSTVSDAPVITMDLFPTVVEMANLPAAAQSTALDGQSLVPVLRSGTRPVRDLFWHYPHHQHYQLGGAMPYAAIRSGDLKLIEFFEDLKSPRLELYDLRADLGEKQDLAASQPQRVAELRAKLHAWQKSVSAQMPTPNPAYDPARPEYNPPPGKKKAAPGD